MNWRTTLTAIVGAAAYALATFGIQVPTEVQTSIVVVTVFVIGILAKDSANDE